MALIVLGALLVILGGAVLDVSPELRQPVAAGAGAAIVGIIAWDARRRRDDG